MPDHLGRTVQGRLERGKRDGDEGREREGGREGRKRGRKRGRGGEREREGGGGGGGDGGRERGREGRREGGPASDIDVEHTHSAVLSSRPISLASIDDTLSYVAHKCYL